MKIPFLPNNIGKKSGTVGSRHQSFSFFQLVIFIDGVNVIFEAKSYVNKNWVKGEKRSPFSPANVEASAEPNELSVIYNLKKLLVSDCPNSAVVASVDRKDILKYGQPHYFMWWKYLEKEMVPTMDTDYPFDLLSQEGKKITLNLLYTQHCVVCYCKLNHTPVCDEHLC